VLTIDAAPPIETVSQAIFAALDKIDD